MLSRRGTLFEKSQTLPDPIVSNPKPEEHLRPLGPRKVGQLFNQLGAADSVAQ